MPRGSENPTGLFCSPPRALGQGRRLVEAPVPAPVRGQGPARPSETTRVAPGARELTRWSRVVPAGGVGTDQLTGSIGHPGGVDDGRRKPGPTSPGPGAGRIVLMGPPGAGKGTQARRLARECGLVWLSSGELLRAAIAEGSPLGRRVKDAVESGELVPDGEIGRVVLGWLDGLRRRVEDPRFVLDGFPRSLSQAQALERWETSRSCPIDAVVRIVVSRPELERRLRRRARTARRLDDAADTVADRQRLDDELSVPLIDYYRRRGLLVDVDGEGDAEGVTARIEGVVGCAPYQAGSEG